MVQSLRHEIGGFVEVNPEGGKESRAAAASPQLESGNWYCRQSEDLDCGRASRQRSPRCDSISLCFGTG